MTELEQYADETYKAIMRLHDRMFRIMSVMPDTLEREAIGEALAEFTGRMRDLSQEIFTNQT